MNRPWPFSGAPADCDDLDEAFWHALRAQTDGQLPRQDLRAWIVEQRARRTRDAIGDGDATACPA